MPPPIRPRLSVPGSNFELVVSFLGCGWVVVRLTDDSFHSGCGALQETREVYLINSQVAARLADGQPTSVLEVGVGTAMALLLCIESSLKTDAEFTYVGLERDWVSSDVMRALQPWDWLVDRAVADRYLEWRDQFPQQVPPGLYEWRLDHRRRCVITVGNALDWQPSGDRFDAIFFDPFAPATNPELWQWPMLSKMRKAISDDGRLVTYCVNRAVRDTFENAGFRVTRVPGPPGGKREVLVAFPGMDTPQSSEEVNPSS